MNSSENFAFQDSLWSTQARKASYFLKTQKDFGPESGYDSVEKLLLDMNCCSFVFSRDKFELWKLASDFKSFKKIEHPSINNQCLIILKFFIIFSMVEIN